MATEQERTDQTQNEQTQNRKYLSVKVQDQTRETEICFKIKKTTQFQKLMHAYSARVGRPAYVLRFLFEGDIISPDSTPRDHEMEDEDIIDVLLEQGTGMYWAIAIGAKWSQLQSCPEIVWSADIHNIDSDQFIIKPSPNIHSNVYKYNAMQDSYSPLFSLNDIGSDTKIAFNESNQTLYAYQNDTIYCIDLTTNKIQMCNEVQIVEKGTHFLFINDHLHIINNHNKHWIASIGNNDVTLLSNTFNDQNINDITSASVIYIPSKQLIVLIGGYYNKPKIENVSGDIWTYSLITQKWEKINNLRFKRWGFSSVLTSNQRYIVLIGGSMFDKIAFGRMYYTGINHMNDIFVLDMKNENNWKIRKSTIKCPKEGECYVGRTGGMNSKNKILVVGYVKELFNMKEMKELELPPKYIIELISQSFSGEMIHYFFDRRSKDHYGIYLNDILSSLL